MIISCFRFIFVNFELDVLNSMYFDREDTKYLIILFEIFCSKSYVFEMFCFKSYKAIIHFWSIYVLFLGVSIPFRNDVMVPRAPITKLYGKSFQKAEFFGHVIRLGYTLGLMTFSRMRLTHNHFFHNQSQCDSFCHGLHYHRRRVRSITTLIVPVVQILIHTVMRTPANVCFLERSLLAAAKLVLLLQVTDP